MPTVAHAPVEDMVGNFPENMSQQHGDQSLTAHLTDDLFVEIVRVPHVVSLSSAPLPTHPSALLRSPGRQPTFLSPKTAQGRCHETRFPMEREREGGRDVCVFQFINDTDTGRAYETTRTSSLRHTARRHWPGAKEKKLSCRGSEPKSHHALRIK